MWNCTAEAEKMVTHIIGLCLYFVLLLLEALKTSALHHCEAKTEEKDKPNFR